MIQYDMIYTYDRAVLSISFVRWTCHYWLILDGNLGGPVRSLTAAPVQAPEVGGGRTCPLQAERQRRGNIRRALEFCEEDLPGLVWAPMTGAA